MAVSLDEINNLVWRYLSESGFQHTAFLFKTESMVDASDSLSSQIPSASLISILQKALLYNKLEKKINRARLDPNDQLHDIIIELEKKFPELEQKTDDQSNNKDSLLDSPMPGDRPYTLRISSSIASILTGHRLTVFTGRWSPDGTQLGTASEDGTAIIWTMNNNGIPTDRKILGISQDNPSPEHLITSIDWECSGKYFATGSGDCSVKIYNNQGDLLFTMNQHKSTVYALSFSPSGNFLVSCSADKTAILWNVANGQLLHIFGHHTDTIFDVCWKDDATFATASGDTNVGICMTNGKSVILNGHTMHVTAIDWNSNNTLLASASEDKTIRIWIIDPNSPLQPSNSAITATSKLLPVNNNNQNNSLGVVASIVLEGHQSGVSCVKWIKSTPNILASAGQDGSILFMDVTTATILSRVNHHTLDIFSLCVSPSGEFVATGGNDQTVDITRVHDGEVMATFIGSSPVYEVAWDPSGSFISICFDDSTVAVIYVSPYLR